MNEGRDEEMDGWMKEGRDGGRESVRSSSMYVDC